MAKGLSYLFWGLGRGYVSETNLTLAAKRGSPHAWGLAACLPAAQVWEDGGAHTVSSPSPGQQDLSLPCSCGAVLAAKAGSRGRPEDSLVLHSPMPLPPVIPHPFN